MFSNFLYIVSYLFSKVNEIKRTVSCFQDSTPPGPWKKIILEFPFPPPGLAQKLKFIPPPPWPVQKLKLEFPFPLPPVQGIWDLGSGIWKFWNSHFWANSADRPWIRSNQMGKWIKSKDDRLNSPKSGIWYLSWLPWVRSPTLTLRGDGHRRGSIFSDGPPWKWGAYLATGSLTRT